MSLRKCFNEPLNYNLTMKQLTLLFLLALMPIVASADDSGKCGDNLTWTYSSESQTLTISGTGEMYNYSSAGPWYKYRESITIVVIENGVTSIADYAFSGCISITSVSINSNTIISKNRTSSNSLSKIFGSQVKEYIIGDNVTRIGNYAFSGCRGLTSVEIPNSVTSIDGSAFYGCNSLSKVKINCKNIGNCFSKLSSIKEVILGEDVISIGESAFESCAGLTSIKIPSSVTSIGERAFDGCVNLKSVILQDGGSTLYFKGVNDAYTHEPFYNCPSIESLYLGRNLNESVSSFGTIKELTIGYCVVSLSIAVNRNLVSLIVDKNNPKYDSRNNCNAIIETKTNKLVVGCKTTVIPNSVTSIRGDAFYNCTGLTSIYIPGSVTSIGDYAFYNCTGLIKAEFANIETLCNIKFGYDGNPLSYAKHLYIDGMEVTDVTIPSSVTSIGDYAFYGCKGLTSIDIPSSVTSIGWYAFHGCEGLTSIEIPSSVTSIRETAFTGCPGLTSVAINSNTILSQKYTSSYPFWDIFGSQVKEYILGDNVTEIGDYAFSGCNKLESIFLPDNIVSFGNYMNYLNNCSLYTRRGTKTLLTLWNSYDKSKLNIYDKDSHDELLPPTMSAIDTTQTTAKISVNGCDLNDGYTYKLNGEVIRDTVATFNKLRPDTQQELTLEICRDSIVHTVKDKYTTKSLEPRIDVFEVTASSISATGAYTEEDAKVVGHSIKINASYNENYDAVDGNKIFMSGLNPGWGYDVLYTIEVDYGGEGTATYTGSKRIYTEPMKFQTAQAKVVSVGNVIVSTTVNLDENEENVGFEWRCTDWTDEFPSNTGTAYLYDGTIEGYIRNLNTDKLWKFRPYYLSNSGTYHYGDWMGVDPTNTSYFEPTVRTYAKINIDGNTALVKGYVLGGTDDIVVKGFKYWKTRTRAAVETRAASIPSDAITVEATGQQTMSANLSGLEYNSTYHYIAFATTSAGDTYYGEEQMFTTPLATSKYSTFYDSETAYILPSGLTASVVTGVKDGKLTYKVIAEGGKSNNILPKGIAVMLTSVKGQPSSYTLTPTESSTSYNGENLLKGSDIDTETFADGGSYWFYKLSYGASGSDYRDVFGWYWGAANGGAFQIEGHKAWLAIPKTTKVGTRAFSVDGDATDIYSIDNEQLTNDNSAIYDLQGREVDMPQSNGIYIVNGKKVYVK